MASAKDGAKTKICARCTKRKPLKEFGLNPRMALGRKSYCMPCSAELQKIWARARRAEKKAEATAERRRRAG